MERVGAVAVLVLAHPPVNALSGAVREALAEGLAAAEADGSVTAIVIRGEGKGFSAGADIGEFGQGSKALELGTLCRRIEDCSKPVIAALHGVALGGGLELALAAHYRIANAAARLGLPEVTLGLLPGAGGTQRLPRLVGAEVALRMMLGGAPIGAAEALDIGLIDRVVDGGLTEAALALAAEGLAVRRSGQATAGLRDLAGYQAAVVAARMAQVGNHLPAAGKIVDCVQAAALLPLAQGLAAERMAFADLVGTPQATALRYAFFAERRAATPPPGVPVKGLPALASLGIWGADDAAADLAFQALSAGMPVVLATPDHPALVQALERIATRQEQALVAGLISEDQRDTDWARLTSSLLPDPMLDVGLVLCTPGSEELPLPVQAVIGAAQAAGSRAVGVTVPMAGGLAELSIGPGAALDAAAQVMALARRLGWRVVFAGPGGPVELHLRQALALAEAALIAGGVPADLVAAALAAYGMGGAGSFLPLMPAGGDAVVTACLAALAAEGARMIADSRARRPVDIDAVALLSGLMPRWEGGPMYQADQRGLLVLRADLRTRAEPVFQPAQLIDDLIAEGLRFASLNGK